MQYTGNFTAFWSMRDVAQLTRFCRVRWRRSPEPQHVIDSVEVCNLSGGFLFLRCGIKE
jgi:hypothetical protein